MIRRGRSPALELMTLGHFGSHPPHWNSKSKHSRHCRGKKGWNPAPCKDLNVESQVYHLQHNPLAIERLSWKCEQGRKANITKSLPRSILPYGQISSKKGLGSYQNQSGDEMQQKRPKKGAKSLFQWSWQNSILTVSLKAWIWALPWARMNPALRMMAFPSNSEMQSRSLSSHTNCQLPTPKRAKQGHICSCMEE